VATRSNRRRAREEEPVGASAPCHGGAAQSRGRVAAALDPAKAVKMALGRRKSEGVQAARFG
jgi:hypothetical protein